MNKEHFCFGRATGQVHAEAKFMHTINQLLQPMRRPGEEYNIVSIHQ